VVQRALDELEGEPIDVFVVWIPAIGGDRYEATDNAMTLIPDERARHYWDGSQALGEALSPALGIRAKMAWDVYAVYGASIQWGEGDAAPPPTSWLHQKAGEDPALELTEEKLVEQLREALK
jgi:hypothetical protein